MTQAGPIQADAVPAKGRMSRETLLPLLAAHVLRHGLAGISLRPLAKAAGTSDRMLLYHFGSKDALMAELLKYLAELYAQSLDAAFPSEPAASRQQTISRVVGITRTPPFVPFMRLWWELVAGASGGNEHYRTSAQTMMDELLEWLEQHMPVDDPDPVGGARRMFTIIEGALMMDAVGRSEIADAGIAAGEL